MFQCGMLFDGTYIFIEAFLKEKNHYNPHRSKISTSFKVKNKIIIVSLLHFVTMLLIMKIFRMREIAMPQLFLVTV